MRNFKFMNSQTVLQRGFTLTGLMISIALVQIVVLVSLKFQSVHHGAVADIREASTHNRVLTTALAFSQKELRGAGFGIVDATANDTMNPSNNDIITTFTLGNATTPPSTSILWRYQNGATVECRGLRETGVTIDDTDYRQLEFISDPTNCNLTSNLSSFVWNVTVANLGLWEINDSLQQYLDTNGTLFNFQVNTGTCAIPQLTTADTHAIARVQAPNTAALNGNVVPSNISNICLVNI